ncbi:xanthine dehydrogenase subunit XdhB, partial [Intestinimonas aquisgranensis]
DVLIKIREGKLAGCRLVSIHGLDAELAGVKVQDSGDLAIGPLTTFHNVTFDPLIRAHVPVLGEAADMAGGPQLRAVGTIGGNVCNGVTSADTASTLMAFGAQMHVQGPDGWRVVPIDDWYKGVGKVDLRPAELLCRIVIPKANFEGWTGHYIKYAQRNAMDIATLGVSCLVKLSADKTVCEDVRLAFGVAAPTPIRSHTAEDGVRGLTVAQAAEQIGDLALQDINPRTSWRASKEFRVQLVKELSGRALLEAARKGGAQV